MKTIVILIFLLYAFSSCFEYPPLKTGHEGQILPSFTFMLTDSITKINTDNIKEGQPFAIFYFSPDCPYCRAQIRSILDHHEQIKDRNFYFLSNSNCTEVKKIINEFDLFKYSNIVTAIDSKNVFSDYFFISTVPYMAVFDQKKKLKQVFIGKTDFDKINLLLQN
jgi:thiol-disulfide isomerase/thioredoxin